MTGSRACVGGCAAKAVPRGAAPSTPERDTRSEPARSTRWSAPSSRCLEKALFPWQRRPGTLPCDRSKPGRASIRASILSVKTQWLRDERSLRSVRPTDRCLAACSRRAAQWLQPFPNHNCTIG
jgi:hypothetical protein